MTLAFRPAADADLPLVVDSWAESYRTAHAAGMIAMSRWRDVMEVEIRAVLARPGCEVTVAHHPGEEGTRADVYGWIAVEHGGFYVETKRRRSGRLKRVLVRVGEPLVHYVFVKRGYRRMGLARRLLVAAGVDVAAPFAYTCKTGVVSRLSPKIPRARWEPLIARFPPAQEQEDAEKEAGPE